MPRDKFRRQYLYVSDAQYLTSNVDLSQHYSSEKKNNNNNNIDKNRGARMLQLQIDDSLMVGKPSSQLDRNVRLVLDELMLQRTNRKQPSYPDSEQPAPAPLSQPQPQQQREEQQREHLSNNHDNLVVGLKRLKELDLSASSASSSDSGVFPNGCHSSSSSCSSTSSLADDSISIDMTTNFKCRCHSAQQSSSADFNLIVNQKERQAQVQEQEQEQEQVRQVQPPMPEETEFGQCALDWHKPSHANYHQNKLVALISAGMTTGSDKKYVTDTVSTLAALGYEVCVFIRRGVGGLRLSSSKFFSPAKWRDFEAALWSVRQQRPSARLVAVGFSFGSIELCRYLAMSGARSLVDAALLVSCPFDPEAGGRNMRRRALNRRIDAYLAHSLGKQLYQARISTIRSQLEAPSSDAGSPKDNNNNSNNSNNSTSNSNIDSCERSLRVCNFNGSVCDLSRLPKLKSLVDFEDNYNRIIQNYPSSEAYAADCRLHEHLQNIQTPTLCLSSEDDFMAPRRLLPLKQIKANDNLCMLLTKRGGHMAFIDGLIWPKKPYFAQRIIGAYMEGIKDRLPAPAQPLARPAGSSILMSCSAKDASASSSSSSPARTLLSSESRQSSQDSAMSAQSHWHLIPMSR